MSADPSPLFLSSRGLTPHLSQLDSPSVNLSLDQIKALSQRLVSRQPGTLLSVFLEYSLTFHFQTILRQKLFIGTSSG